MFVIVGVGVGVKVGALVAVGVGVGVMVGVGVGVTVPMVRIPPTHLNSLLGYFLHNLKINYKVQSLIHRNYSKTLMSGCQREH